MTESQAPFDAKEFLKQLTTRPGVYRMLGDDGEILYVGKASNLRNRVSNYFQPSTQATSRKTRLLMQRTARVEVSVTRTEAEALFLECNLIKKHQPRYNVLLRDDKSYPYIHVSTNHAAPRISFYRGSLKRPGRFFGPYANARSVRQTINQLQRLFQLRPCKDSFYANRSRPCLQYQIQRCSAPCVGFVSEEQYAGDVENAIKFLEGKNSEIIDALVSRMEEASQAQQFERAAMLRDQVARLRQAQEQQVLGGEGGADFDVIALARDGARNCVAVMFVRAGGNYGTRSFFPRASVEADPADVLSSFLAQFYVRHQPPKELLVDRELDDRDILEAGLTDRAGHTVRVRHNIRGERARLRKVTAENAAQSLRLRFVADEVNAAQFDALADFLDFDEAPDRIECFDISHSKGEAAVASCVVFGPDGPVTDEYRRFNISGISPGDDYAALQQAITRRYRRILRGEFPMPGLLLVDGGPRQLDVALGVMDSLDIEGPAIAAVSKGADRRVGQERLHIRGQPKPVSLEPDSPALHLIQRIRDEAHRFAITGHRRRRAKPRSGSVLDEIPGVGPKRRRELLRQFGGLQGLAGASVDDIARTRGISRQLAESIYEHFHGET